jgi:hypothetical protein
VLLAHRHNRRTHGGTRRYPVIDQYHPLPDHDWRRTFASIDLVSSL